MRLSETRRQSPRSTSRVPVASRDRADGGRQLRGAAWNTVDKQWPAPSARWSGHVWPDDGAREGRRAARTAVLERAPHGPQAPAWRLLLAGERDPRGRGRGPRLAAIWRIAGAVGAFALVAAGIVAALGPGWGLISHASAPPNPNCTLLVPVNPLSAQGLATPYELAASDPDQGPCRESNAQQMAFAQAAVLDPATGAISVYDPLVVTRGTRPAVAPVAPKLPANAVVALWFGFNGTTLRLRGTGAGDLAAAHCVNGLPASIFGQVSYCNAVQFFASANAMIQAHKIMPPALGMGKDGLVCPTVRDFSVVDQDQSDNVTTAYLVTAEGRVAQTTGVNVTALTPAGARMVGNGSDNGLLVALDRALGCTPWMVPDLADPGKLTTALPLNELQAAMDQAAPVATVPVRDPMVLAGNDNSLAKLNLYRAGVDQLPVTSLAQAQQDELTYCQQLFQIAPARLLRDRPLTQVAATPLPLVANNLFTFLAQRFNFSVSKQGLGCTELVEMRSPIKVKTNERGVVVEATIWLAGTAATPASAATPGAATTPAATTPAATTPAATTPAATPTAAATATPGDTPVPTSTPAPASTPTPGKGGDNDDGHGG